MATISGRRRPDADAVAYNEFCPGERLFDAGTVITTVDVIIEGHVALVGGSTAAEVLVVAGPGSCLVTCGMDEHAWTARAVTPGAVARFDRELLRDAAGRGDVLAAFVSLLSITPFSEGGVPRDSAMPVAARVARELLRVASGRQEFDLPMTQRELGQVIRASRERVNRAIADLVGSEVVERTGRRFRILDAWRLAEIADGGKPLVT